jgi:hypothetical protein
MIVRAVGLKRYKNSKTERSRLARNQSAYASRKAQGVTPVRLDIHPGDAIEAALLSGKLLRAKAGDAQVVRDVLSKMVRDFLLDTKLKHSISSDEVGALVESHVGGRLYGEQGEPSHVVENAASE